MERSLSEKRRKRIMERGSDRIAQITSLRLSSLQDSPSSPSAYSPSYLSSPSSHFSHCRSFPNRSYEDVSVLYSPTATSNLSNKGVPQLRRCETTTETVKAPLIEPVDKLPLSPVAPKVDKTSDDSEPSSKPRSMSQNMYSPREISSCIMASENTRVSCSIVIALLVVLSNISLPRNIVKSRSVIVSNPLYVLLVTDFTIMIGWLTVKRRSVSLEAKEEEEEEDGEEVGLKKDKDLWGGAFKILELGLVLHQIIRGIFIDFSFYAVIVVCGLSLL